MAGLLRPGSLARSRGVHRRGAGRPSGSTTRGCTSPRVGSARNSSASSASTVGVGSRASSSRKNSRSPSTRSHPGVAAGGDAEVGRQSVGADPVGQSGRLPAVADHHDIQVHVPLLQQGLQPALQIGAPLAHGQHDHPVARPRRHRRRSSQPRRAQHRGQVADQGDRGGHAEPDQQPLRGHPVEPEIEQRGHQDQQRQLDGVEDPVERDEPGDLPGPAERALRPACGPTRCPASAADRRSAGTRARGRSPPCSGRPAARAAARGSPRRCRARARGRPGSPAPRRSRTRRRSARPGPGRRPSATTSAASAPPRRRSSRAASAAGSKHHGHDRARQRPPGRGERGQHRAGDHQPGDAVGGEAGLEQDPGQVGRDVPQVRARHPVLGSGPGPHARRLGDVPQLGDRRIGRTTGRWRPLEHPVTLSAGSRTPHLVAGATSGPNSTWR